jgi:Nif-specific regulatory protein
MTELATAGVRLPLRYQLQEILKESPSTAVYKVFDSSDGRVEAIKILRHEFAEEERLRFQSEFKLLLSLHHPSIVQVYDFGLIDDVYPYFTMEFFSGRKITEFFDGKNWDALYRVLFAIASGLHHVHHLGIVHLDLKPSNILVDDDGNVKLMDFGLAEESHALFDRRIRGTIHYMAPEVLRQDKVDVRADLYALGMTLYETVTGALPTYGRPPIEVMRFHLDEEIRKPSSINPNVPIRLQSVILKLLEKDPRDRYSSAAELLHDLAEHAAPDVAPAELLVGSGELLVSPLIARGREIQQILDTIESARNGVGGGMLVIGAEGLGKSRIVREATLRGQIDGARVFCGRCPVNRKTIYAPFFEIFQAMLRGVNPDADAASELRRMIRAVSGAESARAVRNQKFRLFNRIVQSIQDFYGFLNVVGSSRSPLILVVEDLQWADASTAELFFFLVGEARHSNLVVLGTFASERGSELPLADAGVEWREWEHRARETGTVILRVEPLDENGIAEFVASVLGEKNLPPELLRWVQWESGGSPRNIRNVIDFLIAQKILRSTTKGWEIDTEKLTSLRIPGGASSVSTDLVEALDEPAKDVLATASILGEFFELSILTKLVERRAAETFEIVQSLVSAGLLDESAEGKTVAFPQLSLRETVYASLPEWKRAELHRRAGMIYEAQLAGGSGELLGQVAYHFGRGNDTTKGIDYSIRAGEQATAALAHDQAAEFYRVALELMDLAGDDSRKSEIRERLGDSYHRAGNLRGAMQVFQFLLKSLQQTAGKGSIRSASIVKKIGRILAQRGELDAALSYFQRAILIYRRLDAVTDVAEMSNRIAWVQKEKGDLAEAEKSALEASRLVEGVPIAPIHGYVKITLGLIAFARGEWNEARKLFEQSCAIAESVSSDQLLRLSTTHLANVLWKLGAWNESLVHYRRNLERSEADGDLAELERAYEVLSRVEIQRGNFHEGAFFAEKSLRISEKLGSNEGQVFALATLGEALERIGRWKEGRDRLHRASMIDGDDKGARALVHLPLARLSLHAGDLSAALTNAQRAGETFLRAHDPEGSGEASLLLAEIEIERENLAETARHLDEAAEHFSTVGTRHADAKLLTARAELALREQKLDEAKKLAEQAGEIANGLGDRFTLARIDWVSGRIAFLRGDRAAGESLFEKAHAVFDEIDAPYEDGRLFFDLGVLRDDPDEALQALRRAIKIFERLEAEHDLERARGALFRIKPAGKSGETNVIGLYEVVKIINSALNVEEVLERVLDIALRRVRAERGMILLLDPITNRLKTRVVRNMRDGETESKRSPQSIIREVMQTGIPVISADARADERFVDSDSVISENIVSTLCVPLVIRERIAGAIYVDHRETRHLFTPRDLSFLEAFADQAAIAIENARLYEELEAAKQRLSAENETLRREVLVEKHLDSIVGSSDGVARIQFAIRKAAAGASTVLVRGESGTGKGLVARIIHNVSPRRHGPFIKFNCAALPETLAESELFGHEKGAFTGADRRKLGRFELANGGTIFLDEIGKVSLAIQAKLLRVVEDKEFERVGGTQTIKTDVKIITATNLDLERAIREGTFREDLFYRLNIIPIHLPPLRDRKADIPQLVEHFIRKICRDLGVENKRINPDVLELFHSYSWPGNVRELEAMLHRAIVMTSNDVLEPSEFYMLRADASIDALPTAPTPTDVLPRDLLNPAVRGLRVTGEMYDEIVSRVDRQLIEIALAETGGKIRETARRLGLARNTLRAKLLKYRISSSDS